MSAVSLYLIAMVNTVSVTTEKPEPGVVSLTIEVPVEEVERAREQAWRRLAQRVQVPGFRRGKAPRALVERQVGIGVVNEEALRTLVPQAFDRAVDDAGIAPVERPQFSLEQMEPSQPLVVRATVTVQPTVDPGDYQSVHIEPEPVEITEEEVERAVEQARQAQSRWLPAEDRELTMSDQAVLDLTITWNDGRASEHKDLRVVLGENSFPQGFDEHVVGTRPGETGTFTLTWTGTDGEGVEAERLAEFRAEVKAVNVRELPGPEEVAHALGLPDAEALRDSVRDRLRLEKERAARARAESAALEAAVEGATFEIAGRLVDLEAQAVAEEQRRTLAAQRITLERYLGLTGRTNDQWEAEQRESAQRQLKARLLLDKIAERESISVAPEEITEEIERASLAYGPQAPQVRRQLSTPDGRRRLERSIRRHKTMEWLANLSSGQMTDVTDSTPGVAGMGTRGAHEEPAAQVS